MADAAGGGIEAGSIGRKMWIKEIMDKPDFFIVGAPKCGTTSLTEYLREHPEIYMPRRKELHYFGTDLQFFKAPRITASEYFSHFTPSRPQRRLGECSVWYLYSRRAASEIHKFNPAAQIIIMLRNPVDMLASLHGQFCYESNEDIADFPSALAAEADRRRGLRIPQRIYFPAGLQYRRVIRYAEQVRRYVDLFGPENVHVVDFSLFASNTAAAYADVLDFLGVDLNFRCDLRIHNPSKQIRLPNVQSFLNNPSPFTLNLARLLVPTRVRHALIALAKRFNAPPAEREPLDPRVRCQLEREFEPEIEQLSDLLNHDFGHWFSTIRHSLMQAV